MAVDITIKGTSGTGPGSFDSFVGDDLPGVARAIAVVADDPAQSTDVVAVSTRALFDNWARTSSPDRDLYSLAIAQLLQIHEDGEDGSGNRDPDLRQAVLQRACTVSHFGLEWSINDVAESLDLTTAEVEAHLTEAHAQHRTDAAEDLPATIKHKLADAEVQLPTVTEMRHERLVSRRRTQLVGGAVSLGALVFLFVLLGQFGSGRDRAEPVLAPTQTAATQTAPPQTAPPQTAPTQTAPTTRLAEDRITAVPPDLIADDGQGGFVGVRAGDAGEPAAVFVTSPRGSDWRSTGSLNLSPSMVVDRFARSGANYVAWLSEVTTPSDEVIGTVGVTPDFEQWSFLRVALDEPAPRGLDYDFEISQVVFRQGTILALVTTTFEINFAELQLVESNTCGHSIAPDIVVVKLCNGGEIDVLSAAGIDQLPRPTRLFTGTDGFALSEVETPFLQNAAGLVSTETALLLTDAAGVWLATSSDGQTWIASTQTWPPEEITAAFTNDAGHVVGVVTQGDPTLHSQVGDESFEWPLTSLIPLLNTQDPFDVALRHSDETWAVYIATSEGAWFLLSNDARTWTRLKIPRVGAGEPTLFVGAEHAILQWLDEPRTTVVVNLS